MIHTLFHRMGKNENSVMKNLRDSENSFSFERPNLRSRKVTGISASRIPATCAFSIISNKIELSDRRRRTVSIRLFLKMRKLTEKSWTLRPKSATISLLPVRLIRYLMRVSGCFASYLPPLECLQPTTRSQPCSIFAYRLRMSFVENERSESEERIKNPLAAAQPSFSAWPRSYLVLWQKMHKQVFPPLLLLLIFCSLKLHFPKVLLQANP